MSEMPWRKIRNSKPPKYSKSCWNLNKKLLKDLKDIYETVTFSKGFTKSWEKKYKKTLKSAKIVFGKNGRLLSVTDFL